MDESIGDESNRFIREAMAAVGTAFAPDDLRYSDLQ
jgi:hypothetical protein